MLRLSIQLCNNWFMICKIPVSYGNCSDSSLKFNVPVSSVGFLVRQYLSVSTLSLERSSAVSGYQIISQENVIILYY